MGRKRIEPQAPGLDLDAHAAFATGKAPLQAPAQSWLEDEALVLLALTDSVPAAARQTGLPLAVVERLGKERIENIVALRRDYRKILFSRGSRLLTILTDKVTGWVTAFPDDEPPKATVLQGFRSAVGAMAEIQSIGAAILPPTALETVWSEPGPDQVAADKAYVERLMGDVLADRQAGRPVRALAETTVEEGEGEIDLDDQDQGEEDGDAEV